MKCWGQAVYCSWKFHPTQGYSATTCYGTFSSNKTTVNIVSHPWVFRDKHQRGSIVSLFQPTRPTYLLRVTYTFEPQHTLLEMGSSWQIHPTTITNTLICAGTKRRRAKARRGDLVQVRPEGLNNCLGWWPLSKPERGNVTLLVLLDL